VDLRAGCGGPQQCNCDVSADNHKECSLPLIIKKLKVAGGADYDTGSNAAGYQTKAGSLRSSALASYREKEKEGNIAGVVYVTSALPNTTPVDLGGRPMVASASEAQKCVAVPSTPLHTLSCFLFAHLCTRPLTAL